MPCLKTSEDAPAWGRIGMRCCALAREQRGAQNNTGRDVLIIKADRQVPLVIIRGSLAAEVATHGRGGG